MSWRQCKRPELPEREVREYQAEFETPTHEVEQASTVLRPDAVGVDHHTAFTLGPIAIADPSQGLVARVWRARAEGTDVLLCRGAPDNGHWEPEAVLFSFDDGLGPLTELDVAFEQNGQPVVCMERPTGEGGAPEIWIHFYDPTVPGMVFRNFGPGRTPRSILDSPHDVAGSDVVIFYVSGSADGLVYRQQRDRYAVEIATPATGAAGLAVEDAVRTPAGRVVVLLSRHDPDSGTYTLERLATALPTRFESDRFEVSGEVLEATVEQAVIPYGMMPDAFQVSGAVLSAVIRALLIELAFSDRFEVSGEVVSAAVRTVIIEHRLPADSFEVAGEVVSAGVELQITIRRPLPVEAFEVAGEVLSATVEAA